MAVTRSRTASIIGSWKAFGDPISHMITIQRLAEDPGVGLIGTSEALRTSCPSTSLTPQVQPSRFGNGADARLMLRRDRGIVEFGIALRRGVLVLICLAGMGATTACGKSYSWNQKLTIEVETPDGIKTGSGVVKWTLDQTKWGLPEARGIGQRLYGEAAIVELAPGDYLFVLPRNMPRGDQLLFPGMAPMEAASKLDYMLGQGQVLRADEYPILVTFVDPNNPRTLASVDPLEGFGEYRIKRISVTITNEEVTRGRVYSVLNWLSAAKHERFNVIPYQPETEKYAALESQIRLMDLLSLTAGNSE